MKISQGTINIIGDYCLSIAALIQPFILLIQLLFGDAGIMSKESLALFRVFFSGIIILAASLFFFYRKPLLSICTFSLFLSLFFISLLLNPLNADAILEEGIRLTLAICIPIFLSVSSIKCEKKFFKVYFIICWGCAIVGVVYGLLFFTLNLPMLEDAYNMSYGYALLFPAMFFLYKNRLLYRVLAFILLLLIVLIGSRGPLIPFLLFLLWQRFVLGTAKEKIVFVLLLLLLFVFLPCVLDLLSSWDINSRTISLFVDGEIDKDSGRNDIYKVILDKISENFVTGCGLFGDRVFLDGYCHNIFLELFVDFGVILPLILIIIIVPFFFNMLRHLFSQTRDFFIMLGLSTFFPLLVSGSYLTDVRFALFMGFLYLYRKQGLLITKIRKL